MNWVWSSRDNERLSIWNGAFATVSMSIVNGFVAMYLLDSLHASDAEMGLLNSLPAFVNMFATIAAAVFIQRARSKKWFCTKATLVSRSFYVWIALVPFLPVHSVAMWVVWLVALTRLPQSFGDVSWQAMIGDLIDSDRRSQFFSERNRTMTAVGLLVTLLTGLILQQFDKHSKLPYQIAFMATAVFAAAEILLLIRHQEPKATPTLLQEKQTNPLRAWVHSLRSALSNRRFMIAVAVLLFFNFAWQMSWPLFSIFQIRTAHAPALWIGLFAVANSATQVVSFKWWGRMSEKHGNVKMLAVAGCGMAIAPVLTILSTNMYYLFVVNILTGAPVAGTVLLLFNYLLEVSPDAERTTYISNYNVALSLVGFIAPEVGIWLLGVCGMSGGMIVSTVLRLLGGVAFLIVARNSARWLGSSPQQRGVSL